MVVAELAEAGVAFYLGEVMAMAVIPIVGAVPLIVVFGNGPALDNCIPFTHQPRHTRRDLPRCPSITRAPIRRLVRHGRESH